MHIFNTIDLCKSLPTYLFISLLTNILLVIVLKIDRNLRKIGKNTIAHT